jgi:hypothetical protein
MKLRGICMKRKFRNDVMNRVSMGHVASVCRNKPSEDRANARNPEANPGTGRRKRMIRLVAWDSSILRSVTSGNRRHFPDFAVGVGSHYLHQICLHHLHWMNTLIPGILCWSRADTSRGNTWGICARISRQEYIRGRKTTVNSLLRNLLAPCHTLQSQCCVYYVIQLICDAKFALGLEVNLGHGLNT